MPSVDIAHISTRIAPLDNPCVGIAKFWKPKCQYGTTFKIHMLVGHICQRPSVHLARFVKIQNPSVDVAEFLTPRCGYGTFFRNPSAGVAQTHCCGERVSSNSRQRRGGPEEGPSSHVKRTCATKRVRVEHRFYTGCRMRHLTEQFVPRQKTFYNAFLTFKHK